MLHLLTHLRSGLRHFSLLRHNPHRSTRLCTMACYKCIDWLIDWLMCVYIWNLLFALLSFKISLAGVIWLLCCRTCLPMLSSLLLNTCPIHFHELFIVNSVDRPQTRAVINTSKFSVSCLCTSHMLLIYLPQCNEHCVALSMQQQFSVCRAGQSRVRTHSSAVKKRCWRSGNVLLGPVAQRLPVSSVWFVSILWPSALLLSYWLVFVSN